MPLKLLLFFLGPHELQELNRNAKFKPSAN